MFQQPRLFKLFHIKFTLPTQPINNFCNVSKKLSVEKLSNKYQWKWNHHLSGIDGKEWWEYPFVESNKIETLYQQYLKNNTKKQPTTDLMINLKDTDLSLLWLDDKCAHFDFECMKMYTPFYGEYKLQRKEIFPCIYGNKLIDTNQNQLINELLYNLHKIVDIKYYGYDICVHTAEMDVFALLNTANTPMNENKLSIQYFIKLLMQSYNVDTDSLCNIKSYGISNDNVLKAYEGEILLKNVIGIYNDMDSNSNANIIELIENTRKQLTVENFVSEFPFAFDNYSDYLYDSNGNHYADDNDLSIKNKIVSWCLQWIVYLQNNLSDCCFFKLLTSNVNTLKTTEIDSNDERIWQNHHDYIFIGKTMDGHIVGCHKAIRWFW